MLKDRTKLHFQLKEKSLRNIDRENIEKQIETLNEEILEIANRKKKFKETIGPGA